LAGGASAFNPSSNSRFKSSKSCSSSEEPEAAFGAAGSWAALRNETPATKKTAMQAMKCRLNLSTPGSNARLLLQF
jgi:hypothetical protein